MVWGGEGALNQSCALLLPLRSTLSLNKQSLFVPFIETTSNLKLHETQRNMVLQPPTRPGAAGVSAPCPPQGQAAGRAAGWAGALGSAGRACRSSVL